MQLMTMPKTAKMSSYEIALLVESRQDNVKRTIERCAESGAITLPPLEEVSNPGPGPKMISIYMLDKRSSLIVVAQLSPQFTARVIDRWQQLEGAITIPTHAEALRLAADTLEELDRQKVLRMLDAPKVHGYEVMINSDTEDNIRGTAKNLNWPEKKLIQFLITKEWLYRAGGTGRLMPHVGAQKKGYVGFKEFIYRDSSGVEQVKKSATVTQKGKAKLLEMEPEFRAEYCRSMDLFAETA